MKNLRIMRESRKLSQQKLADELNLTQQAIHKYETDQSQPDYDTLKKMARFFHTSIDTLLDYEPANSDSEFLVCETSGDYTAEEIHHMVLYRRLSAEQKKAINLLMEGLVDEKSSAPACRYPRR